MKKFALTLSLILTILLTYAQVNTAVNPYPKTISVNGSAEMEIVPDEIFVQVALREYEKKGSGKIDIETIKKKLLEACETAGIADSLISIASYEGTDVYWLRKKKKNPDMKAGISYMVKFSNVKAMDALIEKLDDEATESFNIVKTSHSKIEEFRKQLKIQAVKAAKVKAAYLAESIGEKISVAVTIQEPVDNSILPVFKNMNYARMAASNTIMESDLAASDIDFKKIKLQFEVNAVFALN